jgi:transposase-like protein
MDKDITLGEFVNTEIAPRVKDKKAPQAISVILSAVICLLLKSEADQFVVENNEFLPNGHKRLVLNGYRSVNKGTIFGPLDIVIPKIRDNKDLSDDKDGKIIFHSEILENIYKSPLFIPQIAPVLWTYGISMQHISKVFELYTHSKIKGVSASTISRIKDDFWHDMIEEFNSRRFDEKKYKFLYSDGAYFHVKLFHKKLCKLAILGVTEDGEKDILGIFDAQSESKEEWVKAFQDLQNRGLNEPEAVIGDGGKGLWAAVDEEFKNTKKMQCWVHKIRDIISYLPRRNQIYLEVLQIVKSIYEAHDKEEAIKNFNNFKSLYNKRYPKAVKSIEDNLENLLNFLDYPVQYHLHLRTSNPIESLFSVIRLRTNRFKGCCNKKSLGDVILFYAIQTNQNLTPYNFSPQDFSQFKQDDDPCELALASFNKGVIVAIEGSDIVAKECGDIGTFEVGDFDAIEVGDNAAIEDADNAAVKDGDNAAIKGSDIVAKECGDIEPFEVGDFDAIKFGDFGAIEVGDNAAIEDTDNAAVKDGDNAAIKDDNTVTNKVGDIWEDKDVAEICNTAKARHIADGNGVVEICNTAKARHIADSNGVVEICNTVKARHIADGNGVVEICNTVKDCRIAKFSYSAEGNDVTELLSIAGFTDVANRDIAEVCNIAGRNNIAETDDIANEYDIVDSS